MAFGNWLYFRRKAGGPARLRSASVVKSRFVLKEIFDVFRYLSEFRRRLRNKAFQITKKLVTTMLQHLRNILFGFQALQRVDV